LVRESILNPVAICLEDADQFLDEDVHSGHGLRAIAQALQTASSVTFLLAERPWSPEGGFRDGVFQRIALDLPDKSAAKEIWIRELANENLDPQLGDTESVADQ